MLHGTCEIDLFYVISLGQDGVNSLELALGLMHVEDHNDDDDEELVPRTPLAAASGSDSGAVRVPSFVGPPPAIGGTLDETGGRWLPCPALLFLMARLRVTWRGPALQLMLLELMKVGCRWVGAATPAASQRLCFERKVSSVVSPSSVGLEGGVSGASSVTTRSTHVVGPLDASDVAVLVTGNVSVVLVFLPL
jgi:hypothetical protein